MLSVCSVLLVRSSVILFHLTLLDCMEFIESLVENKIELGYKNIF